MAPATELPNAYVLANAVSRFKRGLLGMRNKISVIERDLMCKVHEDPRFAEGTTLLVSHLRELAKQGKGSQGDLSMEEADITFLTATASDLEAAAEADAAEDVAHGDAAAGQPLETTPRGFPPGSASLAAAAGTPGFEALISSWSKSLVQICLEDWELDSLVSKLEIARLQAERLDKEKIEAHRTYLQELQSVRDRCVKLERGTPVEFTIPVDDVTFYEPTKYLDPAQRQLVKDIVEYKVRQEMAQAKGYEDNTFAYLEKIKAQEERIKELESQLAEEGLEDDEPASRGSMVRRGSEQVGNSGEVARGRRVGMPQAKEVYIDRGPAEVAPALCPRCQGKGDKNTGKEVDPAELEALREEVKKLQAQLGNAKKQTAAPEQAPKVAAPTVQRGGEEINHRGADAKTKRGHLRKVKLERAEMLGLLEENREDQKALSSHKYKPGSARSYVALSKVRPPRSGSAIGSVKDFTASLAQEMEKVAAKPLDPKESTSLSGVLRTEESTLQKRLSKLEAEIQELSMYDLDDLDLTTRAQQTEPMAEQPITQVQTIVQQVPAASRPPPADEPVLRQLARTHDKAEAKQRGDTPVDSGESTPRETTSPTVREKVQRPPPRAAPTARAAPEPEPVEESPKKEREKAARQEGQVSSGTRGKDAATCLVKCSEILEVLKSQAAEVQRQELAERLGQSLRHLGGNLTAAKGFLEEQLNELLRKNEKLQTRNTRLEIAMQEMEKKVAEAQQMLRDAGLGHLADNIFESVGLIIEMDQSGKPISAFERLYRDAMRRLRKDPNMVKVARSPHRKALAKTLKKVFRKRDPTHSFTDDEEEDEEDFVCPHCNRRITGDEDFDQNQAVRGTSASPRTPPMQSASSSTDSGMKIGSYMKGAMQREPFQPPGGRRSPRQEPLPRQGQEPLQRHSTGGSGYFGGVVGQGYGASAGAAQQPRHAERRPSGVRGLGMAIGGLDASSPPRSPSPERVRTRSPSPATKGTQRRSPSPGAQPQRSPSPPRRPPSPRQQNAQFFVGTPSRPSSRPKSSWLDFPRPLAATGPSMFSGALTTGSLKDAARVFGSEHFGGGSLPYDGANLNTQPAVTVELSMPWHDRPVATPKLQKAVSVVDLSCSLPKAAVTSPAFFGSPEWSLPPLEGAQLLAPHQAAVQGKFELGRGLDASASAPLLVGAGAVSAASLDARPGMRTSLKAIQRLPSQQSHERKLGSVPKLGVRGTPCEMSTA